VANGLSATLERARDGAGWQMVARLTADGSGRIAYEDRDITAGVRYGYRLRLVQGGDEWTTGESWFDIPQMAFALHGVRPTPSTGPASIEFTLPDAQPATLDLFDIRGRRVATHEIGAQGAGRHAFALRGVDRLNPGIYLVRLTRGAEVRTTRMVVVGR
jgi:hypothetical protein